MNALRQIEENTWVIINEEEEVIDTITKDTIIDYCKTKYEDDDINFAYIDDITSDIFLLLIKEHNMKSVVYSMEYEKFVTWFVYTCVEYFSNEIVAAYKQRLLDFE